MGDSIAASIRIGGTLTRRKMDPLLESICQAGVSLEWGEEQFQPKSAEDLVSSLQQGTLRLCDDQTSYGEFYELEKICRHLKLSYTRHSDGKYEFDPEVVDWRLGMKAPLSRMGSHSDRSTYVPTAKVEKVLTLLKAGEITHAIALLVCICPFVPELPDFQIA